MIYPQQEAEEKANYHAEDDRRMPRPYHLLLPHEAKEKPQGNYGADEDAHSRRRADCKGRDFQHDRGNHVTGAEVYPLLLLARLRGRSPSRYGKCKVLLDDE